MKNVIVVIGAGSIGQAIARRVSAGKHIMLADLRHENADAAAKTLSDAGFDVTSARVDVSLRASVHALVESATAGPAKRRARTTARTRDNEPFEERGAEQSGDDSELSAAESV